MFQKTFEYFYLFFFPSILSKFNTYKSFDQSKILLIRTSYEQMFCTLISYTTYYSYGAFMRGEREVNTHTHARILGHSEQTNFAG